MLIHFSGATEYGYEVEVVRRALIEAGVVVVMTDGTQHLNATHEWNNDKNLIEDEKARAKTHGHSRQAIIKVALETAPKWGTS